MKSWHSARGERQLTNDIGDRFLRGDTAARLAMVETDANATVLCRWLGTPAYEELRRIARRWFDGQHLGGGPKNVIFVPGVMGSLLMNRPLSGIWWIDVRTRNFIDRLGLTPDGAKDANPDDEIIPVTADPTYMPFLAVARKQQDINHEIFAYDWRKSPLRSTEALRDLVAKLYRENGEKPIHLVAHSMGGLMVRATLMQHGTELWPKLGKIVFIGTPHYGAVAIAGYLKNHLWGFELMAMLGKYLSRSTLRSLWGVLSLLPAPRGIYPGTRLADPRRWHSDTAADHYVHPCANFDMYRAVEWKLDLDARETANLQRILDATVDYYDRLDAAHRSLTQEQRDKMVVIAGVGYQTLFRLAYEPRFWGLWDKAVKTSERMPGDVHRDGDGRVPLASAQLENVGDIRYVHGIHGALQNIPAVYTDVFRYLRGQPMQLPRSVSGALSGHLAEPMESDAPHLDGSAMTEVFSDDPGLWKVDTVPGARMQELELMLEAGALPNFTRARLL